jgi:hypothetical protein
MKINLSQFFLVLGVILGLSACGKSSSGTNAQCNPSVQYCDPNVYGQQQQIYPPGQNPYGMPQGNCGSCQQVPPLPCNSGCGGAGGGYVYNWWDDYLNDDDHDDDHDHDHHHDDDDDDHHHDHDHDHNNSYNSGWKTLWTMMGASENKSVVITPPSDGTYYLSFKGSYTGKSQDEEQLSVKFRDGKNHDIQDLDNKSGSGEETKSCAVNVNFKLEGGRSYKIFLSGNEDSVNNAQLRLTNYWPSDTSKLCD